MARPGATPVADLRDCHVNLVRSDLDRLVAIARLIRDHVRGDGVRYTFGREELRAFLRAGVAGGRIDTGSLDPDLQADILA